MKVAVNKKVIDIRISISDEEAQYILDDLNTSEHQLYAVTEKFRQEIQIALQGCEDNETSA